MSDQRYHGFSADLSISEKTVQVVDAGDGFAVQGNDDIAFAQSGALGGAVILRTKDDHPCFLREIVETHHAAVDGHGLRRDSDIASADSAIANEAAGNEFCRVDADG